MRKREIFSAAAALVWLLLMIILYYAGHKPAEPGQLAGLAQSAWRLLATTGLTLLAGGLGRRILKLDELPPLVRLALQAGLGFGLLSIGVLAVGSSLGLPAWLPWAAWLGLSLLMFRPILAWLREWHALAELWSASGAFERLLASLLGIIFLGALAVALAPPTHYDTLVYHLALPDTYLRVGRVSYLPWLMSWGMPQGAELLYTWAAGLGGIETGALMGWCFGLVAMVGLLGWLSQVFDARAAWVAAAALLGGLTPVVVLSSAYVEWLVFLQALGGLILLLEWVRSGRISRLALAGLFCGLAVGSKYTSAVLAAAGVVLLAWQLRRQPRLFLRQAFIFGGTALLAASPWFLKNLLATGNPLHPLFFNSGSVTAVSIKVYQGVQPFGDWLDILFLPLRATMLGFEAGPGYMFDSGWLLAGLGGLAWLDAGRHHGEAPAARSEAGPNDPSQAVLRCAALVALSGLLVWIIGNQLSGNLIQTRYYFSIFPAFCALAAAGERGLRGLRLGSVRLGRISATLIALGLLLNTLTAGLEAYKQGAPQVALGLKSGEAYLGDVLGWYLPAMQAVRALPEGSLVQMIYEPRSLYCSPWCRPDEILDTWKRARLAGHDDPTAIRQAWRAQGFSHLLVSTIGINFWREAGDPNHTPEDILSLTQFLATLPRPVDYGGAYALYSIQ